MTDGMTYKELNAYSDDHFPEHWERSDFEFLNSMLAELDAELHKIIGTEYGYALYVQQGEKEW